MENDLYPSGDFSRRIDALSEETDFEAFDEAVYRLGFSSVAIAGAPDVLRVGGVELWRGPGPVRTHRTEIQQRPGTELVFDKAMATNTEVGAGHWLMLAQVTTENPGDPRLGLRRWRAQARSAIGLACLVLDDRLAIEQLFEDIILFQAGQAVAVVDQRDLLRHFLPYEVTDAERRGLERLAGLDLDEEGDPSVRASRWYLRAIELGPTPEAVIFFWCALEALMPEGMKKDRAITTMLQEADWNPDLLDASPRELVQLRADIVHRGLDDPERLAEGVYKLETILRVLLRHHLALETTWPEAPGVQRFVGPEAEAIWESWAGPRQVEWHDALPIPAPGEVLGLQWDPIDAREWDGLPPEIKLEGHLEPGWGHRLASVFRGAVRELNLAQELDEVTVAVANREGVPDAMDVATDAAEIVVRPRVMNQPDDQRLPYLISISHNLVIQHALVRRGIDPRQPFGTLLLSLVGTWAQKQFFDEQGIDLPDPFRLAEFSGSVEEPEDLPPLGRALGAAIGGDAEARTRLEASQGNAPLDHLALVDEWRGVESPSDFLDRATSAYAAVLSDEG